MYKYSLFLLVAAKCSFTSLYITGKGPLCGTRQINQDTRRGHHSKVKLAAFSPDASMVVTASCDGLLV